MKTLTLLTAFATLSAATPGSDSSVIPSDFGNRPEDRSLGACLVHWRIDIMLREVPGPDTLNEKAKVNGKVREVGKAAASAWWDFVPAWFEVVRRGKHRVTTACFAGGDSRVERKLVRAKVMEGLVDETPVDAREVIDALKPFWRLYEIRQLGKGSVEYFGGLNMRDPRSKTQIKDLYKTIGQSLKPEVRQTVWNALAASTLEITKPVPEKDVVLVLVTTERVATDFAYGTDVGNDVRTKREKEIRRKGWIPGFNGA